MQLVGSDERLERHMLHIVPVAHDREAVEQIDARHFGRQRNLILHALGLRLGQHARRKLHIDQHHVGTSLLELRNAVLQHDRMRLERLVAQHRIGADLPENEIGMGGDNVGGKTGHHLRAISSPLTPRLSTVMSRPGNRCFNSTARRLG